MSTPSSHKFLRPLLFGIFVVGCFVTAFFIYFRPSITWPYSPIEAQFRPIPPDIKTNNSQNSTILLVWFWPFGDHYDLTVCESEFKIEGCFVTADKHFYSKSHGVLIHHRDIRRDLSNLPQVPRPLFQKWIWMNFESPSHAPQLSGMQNLFNLTVNYRRDADIPIPMVAIVPSETKEDFVPPSKDKLVCWIVSNWNRNHRRVHYFHELKNHINIHTYGHAFGNPVSNQDFKPILASCKFYLSFENSIHKDYITEKLYNPLSLGTVPVVLGTTRQNYENFVPADAFIHVDDFKSPKELADYLNLLDKNEEMYLKYFKWRQHFKARRPNVWVESTCLACDYIKRHKGYQPFNGIDKWFWS